MANQIFISYSKKDSQFVGKLAANLRDKGFKIWYDTDIGGGEHWRNAIEENLKAAEEIIIVLSPNAVDSDWVQYEGTMARTLGKKLYPILAANLKRKQKLPPWMDQYQYIDFVGKPYADAIKLLEKALTPPNPIQDLLDQQVSTYQQTGALMGDAILRVIEEAKNTLEISAIADELVIKSQAAIQESKQKEERLQAEKNKVEKLRIEEQKQANIRLQKRNQILIGALVIALIFGFISLRQTFVANASTTELKNLANIAQANNLLVDHNPDLAVALALHATQGGDPPEKAYATLLDAAYISLSQNVYSDCKKSNDEISDDEYSWVTAVDISPDNKTIAFACSDNSNTSKIYILDLTTGNKREHRPYPAWLYDLAFSPDGETILAGYSDNKSILWSRDGKTLLKLEKHTNAVSAIAFSPDGTMAVTGSYDKSIVLWDLSTGKIQKHIYVYKKTDFLGKFTSVEFSPDGKIVALGDDYGNVIIWNFEEDSFQYSKAAEKHSKFVLHITFSPDGSKIISGSADSTIAIWNIVDGLNREDLLDISNFYPGVWVNCVEYSHNGQKVLAGLSNGLILLWDINSKQLIQTLDGHLGEVESLSISLDGMFAISGARDGTVRKWDLLVFTSEKNIPNNKSEVNSLILNSDGSKLIGGSANGRIYIWDTKSGDILDNWQAYPEPISISEIALSPNEEFIYTVGNNGSTKKWKILWDSVTHKISWEIPKDEDNARSVDINPKGDRAIIGYASGNISLVNVDDGEIICTSNEYTNTINSVRFILGGEKIVSGSNDHTVVLWTAEKCRKDKVLFQHDSWVMNLKISPNGTFLASSSADGTIIIWNLDTQQQVYRLRFPALGINPGLDQFVLSLDFSADGRLLSSGSANGNVAIWSVASGKMLRRYIAFPADKCQYGVHCFWVLDTKFSPEGDVLWASTSDGWIRAWQLIPASNVQELRNWLGEFRYTRKLTEQEKAAYELAD